VTPDISYQLYSSRNFPDLARQTKMLADLGIRHVEPYGGLFADIGMLQAALSDNGLSAPTAHVGAPSWRSDFDGTVAKLKAIGIKRAFMPAVPPDERVQDREGWQKLGQELSGYAERLKDHGIAFGWHNHSFEMVKLPDGSMPLEWILGDDEDVLWQVDIAWAVRGKQDPAALIRRYRDRVASFHVKDLAAEGQLVDEDGWADVGHGIMNWAALLPVMQETSADVWVLEHDNPSDDARFASNSIAAVKSWGARRRRT
jgi:sugar phosphate isomerase/epimerase